MFSFSELETTFRLDLYDVIALFPLGIKVNGLGLYLNPGTEVEVNVSVNGRSRPHAYSKVSVPITSCARVSKIFFDPPVSCVNDIYNGIYFVVTVTGRGSGKTVTSDSGGLITRTLTAIDTSGKFKIHTVKITNSQNSIIGEIYFTSP